MERDVILRRGEGIDHDQAAREGGDGGRERSEKRKERGERKERGRPVYILGNEGK